MGKKHTSGCRPWFKNVACLSSLWRIEGDRITTAQKRPRCFFWGENNDSGITEDEEAELEHPATGSEHFARQDSGLSQIFKLNVSTSKRDFTIKIW